MVTLDDLPRSFVSPFKDGQMRAGAARVDLTPALGGGLAGHGFVAQTALGSFGRLWVTALVLDDGHGERVALLTLDLAAGSRWVLGRAAQLCGLPLSRLVPLVAHSHRAPAGILASASFDRLQGPLFVEQFEHPFDQPTADGIAGRIADAVKSASDRLGPAVVQLVESSAAGLLWNRSGSSYRGIDPTRDNDGEAHADPWQWDRLPPVDFAKLGAWLREEPEPTAPAEDFGARAPASPLSRRWEEPLRRFEALLGEDPPRREAELEAEDERSAQAEERRELARALLLARGAEEKPGLSIDRVILKLLRGKVGPALGLLWKNRDRPRAAEKQIPEGGWFQLVDHRVPWIAAWSAGPAPKPIGALGILHGTPTLVGSRVPVFCGDVPALASTLLGAALGAPVGLGGGALGDANVVPAEARIDELTGRDRTVAVQMDQALAAAKALKAGALAVLKAPASVAPFTRLHPSCWEVEVDKTFPTGSACFGASTLAGADLGRSTLAGWFLEGARAPRRAAPDDQDPKRRLPPLEAPPRHLLFHRLALDRPDQPNALVLLCTPFELSAALGARIRDRVREVAGHERSRVVATSLSTDFAGYAGTSWEYLSQSYEASSTLWGRRTGDVLKAELARACAAPPAASPARLLFDGAPMTDTPAHLRPGALHWPWGTRNVPPLDVETRTWVLGADGLRLRRSPDGRTVEAALRLRGAPPDHRLALPAPMLTVQGAGGRRLDDQRWPVLAVLVLGRAPAARRAWYLRWELPADWSPTATLTVVLDEPVDRGTFTAQA